MFTAYYSRALCATADVSSDSTSVAPSTSGQMGRHRGKFAPQVKENSCYYSRDAHQDLGDAPALTRNIELEK
jgi:hypothetical protein